MGTGERCRTKRRMPLFTMTPSDYGRDSDNLDRKAPVLLMPAPPQQKPTRWQLWRARLFLGEFIFVCLVMGIILIVVPWTPLWTNNSLLLDVPRLREVLMNDFVRGLVSGLGLVDIWLAISEAVGYRESTD